MNEFKKKSDPAGAFGHWIADANGLPAYEYTCDHENDPRAAAFTTCGPGRLHWHQIGNDRLNAIATNRGDVQALESSRGLQWLGRHDPAAGCPGGGIAVARNGENTWCDLSSPEKFRAGQRRIFGTYYFRKISSADGLEIDHRIIAPFGDEPFLLTELLVSNKTDSELPVEIMEFFGVNIYYMSVEMLVMPPARRHFGPSAAENTLALAIKNIRAATATDSEAVRSRFSRRFSYESDYLDESCCLVQTPEYRGSKRPPKSSRAPKNYYPESVFLAAIDFEPDLKTDRMGDLLSGCPGLFLDAGITQENAARVSRRPCLCLGAKLRLSPGETRRLTFAYGYVEKEKIPALVKKMRERTASRENILNTEAEKWKNHLVAFDAKGEKGCEWLEREALWHSAYTRGAALYDEYYENHYLPQGGAYEYLHGARGAVRDFSLFTVALVYLAPRLAREQLEFCMRLMTPSGRLMYANYGFGRAGGAFVHNHPSDLQLFLLWALTEYVFFTRDFEFLNKEIPFYPRGKGSSTVAERVELSLKYLFEKIGFGEHGLFRAGDGDWSDGISLFVKDRRAFLKRGESAFTSAMALYVLPKVAELLKAIDSKLTAEIQAVQDRLLNSLLKAWNGRWFHRGYDGRGRPIGDRRLFLEHHTWLLISRRLPAGMAASVVENIRSILDDPSPFGQMILYPPARTFLNIYEKGWDVNGGVWYAMNFLLTWAYSTVDPALAWKSLRKNSLARRAEVYPDIWYGLWSGPDAYNAHHAPRPGETYYHLPTPSTDFPVMNLNLHSNFLLALVKLCGLEPRADVLELRPAVPLERYALKTPAVEMSVAPGEIRLRFSRKTGTGTAKNALPVPVFPPKVEFIGNKSDVEKPEVIVE